MSSRFPLTNHYPHFYPYFLFAVDIFRATGGNYVISGEMSIIMDRHVLDISHIPIELAFAYPAGAGSIQLTVFLSMRSSRTIPIHFNSIDPVTVGFVSTYMAIYGHMAIAPMRVRMSI